MNKFIIGFVLGIVVSTVGVEGMIQIINGVVLGIQDAAVQQIDAQSNDRG